MTLTDFILAVIFIGIPWTCLIILEAKGKIGRRRR